MKRIETSALQAPREDRNYSSSRENCASNFCGSAEADCYIVSWCSRLLLPDAVEVRNDGDFW